MILEAIRATRDWLIDATYGVDAKLSALDYDGSDTVTAFGSSVIVDETRNGPASRDRLPFTDSVTRCIAVSAEEAPVQPGVHDQLARDGQVTVLIRVGIKNATTENAARDVYYVLRAIGQSLREFMKDANAASRTRNQTYIESIESMRTARLATEMEDSPAIGAVLVTYQIRDLQG